MELKLLRQDDEYSYYENPDKEMVKAIKAIPKPNFIEDYRGKLTFVKIQSNGNYMFEDEKGDVVSMTEEDYNEGIEDTHTKLINEKFDVCKLVNENFMPFQTNHYLIHKIELMTEGFLAGDTYARVSQFDYYEDEIKYSPATSYSLIFICFTPNGEIKNRDHNHNLNKRQNIKTAQYYISKFIKGMNFEAMSKIEYSNNNYFIEKGKESYCLSLEKIDYNNNFCFSLEKRKKAKLDSYYNPGYSSDKIKKPKKVSELSPTEFKKIITEELKSYFSDENIYNWDNK